MTRAEWTYRNPFGEVDLELDSDRVDRGPPEESERKLGWLLYDFKHRGPEARRVVLEIYAELQALSRHQVTQRLDFDFGLGSLREQAIGNEILFAVRSGRLVARTRERSAAIAARRAQNEEVRPKSKRDAPAVSKAWIGLVLLDRDGTPVPGRPYRVVTSKGAVYNGQLDGNGTATLKDVDPGACRVSCPYVEPHSELTHIVAQGEHLSGVAAAYGFDDYAVVWNRPENAGLRKQRPDPHVLRAGDSLYIPELKDSAVTKSTGAEHMFTIRRSPLKLRVKWLDLDAKPIANKPVALAARTLTTDGGGVVEANVDKGAKAASLTISKESLDLALGELNPPDDETDAGWKARLFNLGFLWDLAVEDGDDEMDIALQDFQAEYGLPLNGQLDDATKAQLRQVYGG